MNKEYFDDEEKDQDNIAEEAAQPDEIDPAQESRDDDDETEDDDQVSENEGDDEIENSDGEEEDAGDEAEDSEDKDSDEEAPDIDESEEEENSDEEGKEKGEDDEAEESEAEGTEEEIDFPAANIVEALLISAPQPRTVKQLAKAAGKKVKAKNVIEAIEELNDKYKETGRSFEIIKVNDAYQIMTLPEYFSFVGKVAARENETRKLSPASLDTLAIIAYRQPIMRVDIETIRGVGCGQVLRNLIEIDLVKITGKNTEVPGHPMLYGTTENFMEQFGISALDELPNIEELRRD
ncbi:MAG: SMC-Scp complex subunit ScpB [Planctomycetota bacterium]